MHHVRTQQRMFPVRPGEGAHTFFVLTHTNWRHLRCEVNIWSSQKEQILVRPQRPPRRLSCFLKMTQNDIKTDTKCEAPSALCLFHKTKRLISFQMRSPPPPPFMKAAGRTGAISYCRRSCTTPTVQTKEKKRKYHRIEVHRILLPSTKIIFCVLRAFISVVILSVIKCEAFRFSFTTRNALFDTRDKQQKSSRHKTWYKNIT